MRYRLDVGPQETSGTIFLYRDTYEVGDSCNYRAHEDWGLSEPADIVSFAKRMMTAGFYHTKALMPKQVEYL